MEFKYHTLINMHLVTDLVGLLFCAKNISSYLNYCIIHSGINLLIDFAHA